MTAKTTTTTSVANFREEEMLYLSSKFCIKIEITIGVTLLEL